MIKLLIISQLNILGKFWKENNFSLFIKSDELFCLACFLPHRLALHYDICQDFPLCSRHSVALIISSRKLVLLQLLKTPPPQAGWYLVQSMVLESVTIITLNPFSDKSLVGVLEEFSHTTVWHSLGHLHPGALLFVSTFFRDGWIVKAPLYAGGRG